MASWWSTTHCQDAGEAGVAEGARVAGVAEGASRVAGVAGKKNTTLRSSGLCCLGFDHTTRVAG